MARRGLLAELQYQSRVAARERQRAGQAAVRERNAAVRRAEQAQKAQQRARTQLARASETNRKRLEKEARDAHVAAMEAEVEERNFGLVEIYDDIESLLTATLDVDDYVDLETLRTVAHHPTFDRPDLETPTPPPELIPDPPEPTFTPPEPPKGLGGLFGRKKYTEDVAKVEATHAQAVAEWRAELERLPLRRQAEADAQLRTEAERVAALAAERTRYADQCVAREAEVAERNRQLDELIASLGYGTVAAIQEYVAIVLSNSVYPEHFPVTHDFAFDPSNAELRLRVLVPAPDKLPEIKAYKYTKSTDEITSTPLSQKVCKDRYANALDQVALRSIHEIFEADRRGLIKTIALEIGTETIDPATGHESYVVFLAAGAERESFRTFDLSAVVPASTLERLGAAVSKNPYGLVAADTSGVRRS